MLIPSRVSTLVYMYMFSLENIFKFYIGNTKLLTIHMKKINTY